jgi:sRNA-binding carbon storage regulator CsrA
MLTDMELMLQNPLMELLQNIVTRGASYTLRADLAGLQYILPSFKYDVLKLLNMEISPKLKERVFKDVVKKQKQHCDRQEIEYVETTRKNKYKKRKRNANQSDQYEYKGRKLKVTIIDIKEDIRKLGVKPPSKLKKKEELQQFLDDLKVVPDSYVSIEPIGFEEDEDEVFIADSK